MDLDFQRLETNHYLMGLSCLQKKRASNFFYMQPFGLVSFEQQEYFWCTPRRWRLVVNERETRPWRLFGWRLVLHEACPSARTWAFMCFPLASEMPFGMLSDTVCGWVTATANTRPPAKRPGSQMEWYLADWPWYSPLTGGPVKTEPTGMDGARGQNPSGTRTLGVADSNAHKYVFTRASVHSLKRRHW